ncbi:MAG: hypothetical protein HC858_06165 [Brachymonas sp.]|nr:hypothetical protein [Brachymonas sp.]
MTRLTTLPNRRRALHTLGAVAAIGALPLLSACGSGSTFEPLVPNRFVSFWAMVGQTSRRPVIP